MISGLTPVKSALLLKLLKKITIKVYTKCLANIYYDVWSFGLPQFGNYGYCEWENKSSLC